jgi:formylglycine-generating enzyme required for sulfatase activity
MKTSPLAQTLAIGMIASVLPLHAQTVFDPTADFSITNGNPNGVWSYGWMPTDFSVFTLYTRTGHGSEPTHVAWFGDGPNLWKNVGGEEGYGVPPGFLSLHPGPGYEPSVLRWTAPSDGWAHVQGRFLAGDEGTMLVAVRGKGRAIWQGIDSGAFDFLEPVTGGEAIDFAVYGGYGCGNTPLETTITLDSTPNQPPRIWTQPVGQTSFVGETVRLNVFATGSWPFTYQWLKGEVEIDGATNSTLVLSNATATATGDYTVVVANDFGSVTSAVARVEVTYRPFPYVAEFEGVVGPEWSHRQTEVTPLGNRRFLGQFGNDTVTLILNGLPPHRAVTVSLDLFVINSWDGNWTSAGPDTWDLGVNGGLTLLHSSFLNGPYGDGYPMTLQSYPDNYPSGEHPARTGATENNTLGYTWDGVGGMDSVYHLTFNFFHTANGVALNFSGNGLEDLYNESWGVDNVMVTLSPPEGVPYVQTTLAPTSTWSPTNNLPVSGLIVSGTRALVSLGDSEVRLLDVSHPAAPVALGSWSMFLPLSDAVLAGNLAYLACWETDFLSTVEIVDFTNPAQPALRGFYDTQGYAQDIEVVGSTAYVADSEGGLLILDVSNPASPRKLGSFETRSSVGLVGVAGRYAYLAEGSWLMVVDVANPTSPSRAGIYDAGATIRSLAVVGQKAFVVVSTGRLLVLEMSTPGTVELLGSTSAWGEIEAAGNYAYLATGTRSLAVIDVGDPAHPLWATSVTVEGVATDVAVTGRMVLVAVGARGISVFELQQSFNPPLPAPVVAGGMITLTWATTNDVRLQKATNLVNPVWQDVPESEGTNTVTLPATDAAAFFRLVKGPKLTDRFVWIPPGTFTMGSPPDEVDRRGDEGPQTDVIISRGFWMGKYEVTQGEYLALMGNNPSYFTGDMDRPVEQVDWYGAAAYCATLTEQERAAGRIPADSVCRLPTEAEWEYACRAGTSTRFSYGDDPSYTNLIDYAWLYDPSEVTTHPVGHKLPNPWGLYDMHGNIWEWCQDWWSYGLPGGVVVDPQGPAAGSYHVIRGGGWDNWPPGGARFCRSADRDYDYPTSAYGHIGFRVVLDPGQR